MAARAVGISEGANPVPSLARLGEFRDGPDQNTEILLLQVQIAVSVSTLLQHLQVRRMLAMWAFLDGKLCQSLGLEKAPALKRVGFEEGAREFKSQRVFVPNPKPSLGP